MNIISREELRILVESKAEPAVSLYMPARRTGGTEQDPIRLKNLLKDAEGQLLQTGLPAAKARHIVEPAQRLLSDTHFWLHQGDALAVFLSPALFRCYRLPYSLPELVVVTERFHLKPLLPLFSEDGSFFVLAVSQKKVRFLQCTRYHVLEVTPEAVPESLAATLKYDRAEKHLQAHTTGEGPALFHGQGVGKEVDKADLLRYFQQIDRGLREVLSEERAPLVVAAVDYLHPIYREANTYGHILDEAIVGNPDDIIDEDLQKRGFALVQPYFQRERDVAVAQYNEAAGKGLTTGDVEQAVLAACDGRIASLFVAVGVQQWGTVDVPSRQVRLYREKKPGAEDLLDFIAIHTLTKKGNVYAVPPEAIPGKTRVAAILRY